jgi:hypothetical protein
MRLALTALVFSISFTLVGCEDVRAVKANETTQKLVGTWLREMEHGGQKARRVLVLGADRKFSEILVVELSEGKHGKSESSGEWSFDGTNLKRRYTHEDGRQLSGNFNFATFALTSVSDTAFEGRNHAMGEEIAYRKVPEGTKPWN